MARSGSQSLRATQLGSRLIRENTNQWYSICADLVNTRNAGLRRDLIERQTQGSRLRRPRTRLSHGAYIGDDVIQDMDGSAKSFSSVTQAMCSIKLR